MEKQIYLIVDASIPLADLKLKLKEISPFLDKIQLYNTEKINEVELKSLLDWLTNQSAQCFIYENKKALGLNKKVGIHLDEVEDLTELESQLQRKINKGVTVGNNLEKLKYAEKLGYDYISFCSVFPTKSANVCELVDFENIQKAREFFSGEIFLAGGINEETKQKLTGLNYTGVAVISALMDAENPLETLQKLK
ncbi:thiamine phosphate synthase [Weeksellaceae bacterium TAE3-ERU29]|nr:thiamine phosphate synthase [Weeksellaceae bacterium TAE3-ERU29]